MIRPIFSFTLVLTLALAWAGSGSAEDSGKNPDGATLYNERTCVACHGKDAKTPILPVYPKLAGQNADYMLQQMKDIKSGARNNANTAAMRAVMVLVNEQEMGALASYISTLKP